VYARIARFEGSTPEEIDEMVTAIKGDSGPPEGVPAKRFMMLVDRETGTSVGITFFETEDDLRKGHEGLNAMTGPSGDTGTRRTAVELYEVPIDLGV
jgi:hypothetical protein